jgi:DNA-directed RNA polymerase subunit F
MLSKTRDYLDHFARFKRKENVEAVERLLSAHKELAKFERAQLGSYSSSTKTWSKWKEKLSKETLGKEERRGMDWCWEGQGFALNKIGWWWRIGSLCCDTAEEAKTLVPSLQDKISDDDLQELLDEITKLMGYGNWSARKSDKSDGRILAFVYRMGYICMAWRVEIFLIFQRMKQGAFSAAMCFYFQGLRSHLKKIVERGGEMWNKDSPKLMLDTR